MGNAIRSLSSAFRVVRLSGLVEAMTPAFGLFGFVAGLPICGLGLAGAAIRADIGRDYGAILVASLAGLLMGWLGFGGGIRMLARLIPTSLFIAGGAVVLVTGLRGDLVGFGLWQFILVVMGLMVFAVFVVDAVYPGVIGLRIVTGTRVADLAKLRWSSRINPKTWPPWRSRD